MDKSLKDGKKLVIIGAGEFAEIAYEYFTFDSPHEVVAFAAEKEYITTDMLYDLPVVPFEEVEEFYPPTEYGAFVAATYTGFNRLRTRLYEETKSKGYELASYISSKAFVWRNVTMGDNCFIFENNVLQHHVDVGNNVIMWSGNHIGHRSVIKDNCFLSSHAVIAGSCEIGENCFIGINSTFNDSIKVEKDCFISSGALVVKNTEPGKIYKGSPAKAASIDVYNYFNIEKEYVI